MSRVKRLTGVALILAVVLSGCQYETDTAALDSLTVAPAGPMDGYKRAKQFGGWRDVDKDCQDTRQEVLARDLRNTVLATNRCYVLSGTLTDPYTGKTIAFERQRDKSAVQVDHVVPLAEAWRSGARKWTRAGRVKFANDEENLVATAGKVNRAKGDSTPDEWKPARAYQCEYARQYTRVKARWSLTVTRPEHDALAAMLNTCR